MTYQSIWSPQAGPQEDLVSCPVFEVFYGGARGGGKTDGVAGDWLIHANEWGAHARGLVVRRELPQLDDMIARMKELYYPLFGSGIYNEQRKTFTFPNGATIRMRALERDSDAEKYMGHSYTRVYVEEITNFPDPTPLMKLMATLRSAHGADVGFRATGNPGGPGHTWVKSRYIDPSRFGYKIITDEVSGLQRVFIPAKVGDNEILQKNDPQYIARLKQSGSEALVRAWLDGDWDIIEGAYFDGWRAEKHVIEPFRVPEHWMVFGSFDWGYAAPGSYGLWAVSDGELLDGARHYPKGAMIRIGEDYIAKKGQHGQMVGLRLDVEEQAQRIKLMDAGNRVRYRVADPAIFKEDGGPSQAERFSIAKTPFIRADNARLPGWSQMRGRLKGVEDERGYIPMIYCFNTCVHSIRTIPSLLHDSRKPEDLDTDAEDHVADEWRYACMSRPYVKTAPKPESTLAEKFQPPTMNKVFQMHFANRRRLRA